MSLAQAQSEEHHGAGDGCSAKGQATEIAELTGRPRRGGFWARWQRVAPVVKAMRIAEVWLCWSCSFNELRRAFRGNDRTAQRKRGLGRLCCSKNVNRPHLIQSLRGVRFLACGCWVARTVVRFSPLSQR